jgi:uncharacterized protein (DUF1800 family)
MNLPIAGNPEAYWANWREFRTLKDGKLRQQWAAGLRRWRIAQISALARNSLAEMVAEPESGDSWHRWFWFNHFNVQSNKSQIAPVLASYTREAIGARLDGRFSDLLKAVTMHPAMLMYLDNVRNVKGRGNENHARELLELHTLGVGGGYGQADVAAAAKIMTGWGVPLGGRSPVLGLAEFRAGQHESGKKLILGRSFASDGERELPDLLDHLALQPATARHVSRRLCAWLLEDEPSSSAVERLSAVYLQTKGSLPALWQEAHRMQQETSDGAAQRPQRRKFKDPLRYVTSAVRLLADGASIENARPLERWLRLLGQPMFLRGSPDGYPLKGSDWLSAGQLTQRVELARDIVTTVPRMLNRSDVRETLRRSPMESEGGRAWAGRLSRGSRVVMDAASNSHEAWALLLASPEFMYV